MAKYKAKIWWYELHGAEVEIEANSQEEADSICEDTHSLVVKARDKMGASDTYSDDGDMGTDEVIEVESGVEKC